MSGGASEVMFKEDIPMAECMAYGTLGHIQQVEITQWAKSILMEWVKDSREQRVKMFMNLYLFRQ